MDDNDLAESVLSDWALDDVLEDPEEAPEAHGTHEAASGDATAPAAPAAGENSLGLDTGAEDTMPTAPVPQPQPQPAPSQDTETENLVNLDSEDDAPQTTYGAESQAPPGAFAQAEDSASSDYLSVDLQHDAEEDMTRADGATEELPSQQEPHVSEPTEEHPSDDINRADPPVPEHEHEDTNANAGAGEGEAQGELVDRADNPNPLGAFRAEPDDDDDLGDPWIKADETTQPGDPEQKSTSVGRTEEHEQEDREQEERDKTVEPEPVSSVPSEETKPPAEFVSGGGEPSGETAMDEQQPTPPAAHVETEQPVNQISPEIPVPAGGENSGEVVTDEQQSFPLASHVETDQPANQTPEQTATRPSQEEPERPTGEADSATSVPTTSQAEVKEHETSAQRDEESEHAVPAPVPAIEASGVEAEGGQSGAAGDTQPSHDSASKTDESLPSPPDASRETTSTETGASTQDDPAVVVGQQNEQSSGVSEETSSQQAGESTPTPKATETTEPPTQPQGVEEKEQKPEGASTDANVTVEGESRPSASQTLDGSSTDACSKDIRVDTTAPTTAPAPEGSRPSLSANFESAPPTPATEGPNTPVQPGGGVVENSLDREARKKAKKARQAAEKAEKAAKAAKDKSDADAVKEAEKAPTKAAQKDKDKTIKGDSQKQKQQQTTSKNKGKGMGKELPGAGATEVEEDASRKGGDQKMDTQVDEEAGDRTETRQLVQATIQLPEDTQRTSSIPNGPANVCATGDEPGHSNRARADSTSEAVPLIVTSQKTDVAGSNTASVEHTAEDNSTSAHATSPPTKPFSQRWEVPPLLSASPQAIANTTSRSSSLPPRIDTAFTFGHERSRGSSTPQLASQPPSQGGSSTSAKSPAWGAANQAKKLFSSSWSSLASSFMPVSPPLHDPEPIHAPTPRIRTLGIPPNDIARPQQSHLASNSLGDQENCQISQPPVIQQDREKTTSTTAGEVTPNSLKASRADSGNGPSEAKTREAQALSGQPQPSVQDVSPTADDPDDLVHVRVEDADAPSADVEHNEDDEDNRTLSEWVDIRNSRQAAIVSRSDEGQSDAEDSAGENLVSPTVGERNCAVRHHRVRDLGRSDNEQSSPTTPTSTDAYGNELTEVRVSYYHPVENALTKYICRSW